MKETEDSYGFLQIEEDANASGSDGDAEAEEIAVAKKPATITTTEIRRKIQELAAERVRLDPICTFRLLTITLSEQEPLSLALILLMASCSQARLLAIATSSSRIAPYRCALWLPLSAAETSLQTSRYVDGKMLLHR